ncbi:MAG: 2-oxoglutarate dehydrogenase E1 component [Planctomycetota bacterium]
MGQAPKSVPSSVNGWSAEYIDAQYQTYLTDPDSLPSDVRAFFAGFDLALANGSATGGAGSGGGEPDVQAGVGRLMAAYRGLGHHAAAIDPFGAKRPRPDLLELEESHLTEADLDRVVDAESLFLPAGSRLRDVVDRLEEVYLGPIGVEFQHIQKTDEREWIRRRFEEARGKADLDKGDKAHVLEQLVNATSFETFLQKRYPGDKRFSLEGAESLIPLLDALIEHASGQGIDEIVLGMAHRGRLNVLNQILGKTPEQIFTEFEDTWDGDEFVDDGGDVKYHRGYSATRQYRTGAMVHLAMASNPSHLEAVGSVVLGRTRAKQRLRHDTGRKKVAPLIIHGDAAVAGQGIVYELLQLQSLAGYCVGGAVHVVVNNHIGFTTDPADARSTSYCTDIAKAFECPVFHVNGEDPEAVVAAARFAVEYRQRFHKDVFIDLWCYRKYGHNEQDEASFTQPVRAAKIRQKKPVLDVYAERLVAEGTITQHDVDVLHERIAEALDAAQKHAKDQPRDPTIDPGSERWVGLRHGYSFEPTPTAVDRDTVREVCGALGRTPDGFELNRKLKKLIEQRGSLADADPDQTVLSYADAEILAFGTLLLEGHQVRVSGQDSRRGTFTSRHAMLKDAKTSEEYYPLNNIREIGDPNTAHEPGSPGTDGRPRQARMCIYDSPLSEMGVLGFEYGYSLADPDMLVCWEAQFGDFVNGAQVIIDQFITSAQVKWERWTGLTMMLPHGYEGAGPEHSSARLERFLQACGNENMQVVYPSTGGQIFHVLRRQVKRSFRKPLIIMAPKSMLRVPTSGMRDVYEGTFREMIDDPAFEHGGGDRAGVRRLRFCMGKVYHELAARRDAAGADDVAIVRIEQLYPFHIELAKELVARYPNADDIAWVQEEPHNMGAAIFIHDKFRRHLGLDIAYIGRDFAASPSPGSKKMDRHQQEQVISRAIAPEPTKAEEKPAAVARSA